MFLNQMKPFSFLHCSLWFTCLQVIVLLSSLNFLLLQSASALGNESDHLALLKFRESISNDPLHILTSWNTSTHFCNRPGISCSHQHSQRITSLNLHGYSLHGTISPHVGNLSFLRILNLENNSFYGIIPQELGRLFQLQQLFLTNNTLIGEIPSNLTSCSELRILSLDGNSLVGKIPLKIGSLHKLQELELSRNNLTGEFPASMWNLSSLGILSVGYNHLEGNIPEEIGHLNLTAFEVYINRLSGMLPSSLYNMSSLNFIEATNNQFSGHLPDNMFLNLPNLQLFWVGGNKFSGRIPTSIINASKLIEIDMFNNRLVGQVPNLGMLKDLQWLNFHHNKLGSNSAQDWEFLKSLMNCTRLNLFKLHFNNFGGPLPDLIGNLSNQLSILKLGGNLISGKIPSTLGNLINLTTLQLDQNSFTGIIPDTFGRFRMMQLLSLGGNKLSGKIPSMIGNLSQLFQLDLSHNMLEGNIPPSLGNCKRLQNLDLSQNDLTGAMPPQVIGLYSLSILLNLSHNSLSGSLPTEVGQLKNIGTLDVSENYLSSSIPDTIGDCMSLEYLHLQGNSFHGNIPPSVTSLKGLQYLDLSRNRLSGPIPEGLQNISGLRYLNVSFNMLAGSVPTDGVFQNASALSVVGNDKLCGGISELRLPPCPRKHDKNSKHRNLILMEVLIFVGGFVLLSSILIIYWIRKRTRKSSSMSTSPKVDKFPTVSYQNLYHATNGFLASNLIGSGCHGFIYKGRLDSEENVVAIKVLNLQIKGADKSFIAECNALKNVRHRNLVKIVTCCSSTDYNGNEFKALVFEYMINGSLEQWLYPGMESANQQRTLDLYQRLNILVDIASALHYLHYECDEPIIHCDLKPSNVLLDDDMVAHVSDFGLARILSTIDSTNHMQTSTIGIDGTIGYVPPEYGMGSEASIQGDLYSFGIIILEMFTGRKPTDILFKDGQNLHHYVKTTFPNNLMQIVDPALIQRGESRDEENVSRFTFIHPNKEKCLVSLFKVGLACSMESPQERMEMADVIRMLNHIRMAFLSEGVNRD